MSQHSRNLKRNVLSFINLFILKQINWEMLKHGCKEKYSSTGKNNKNGM